MVKNITQSTLYFFYFLYILKQNILLEGHFRIVKLSLVVFFGLIVLSNFHQLKFAIFNFKEGLINLFLSISIAGILFASFDATLTSIAKVALILVFFVLAKQDNHVLVKMADVGVLSLLILCVLIVAGFLDTTTFSNVAWQKNSMGFINPNIGPYFAFASLYVYFAMRERKKFWFLFSLIFIFWIMLGVYSRTFIVGSVLLIAYKLAERSSVCLNYFIRIFAWFVLIVTIACVAISVPLISGEGSVSEMLKYIDNMSSSRLFFMAKNPFVVSSTGPIVQVDAFDSIYYEILFILGPYVLFWLLVRCKIFIKLNGVISLHPVETYSILVFLFLGLFEGLIFKFSPMVVVVLSIVLVDIKWGVNNGLGALQFNDLRFEIEKN